MKRLLVIGLTLLVLLTGCALEGVVTAPCTDVEKEYLAEMAPVVEAGMETLGRLEAELVAAGKDLPNWNEERLINYFDLYGFSGIEPLKVKSPTVRTDTALADVVEYVVQIVEVKQSLLQTRNNPTADNVEHLHGAVTEALDLGNVALKKLNNLCPAEVVVVQPTHAPLTATPVPPTPTPTPVPKPTPEHVGVIWMPIHQTKKVDDNAFILGQSCTHLMGVVYRLAVNHLFSNTVVARHARFIEVEEHDRQGAWVSCSFKIEWGEDRSRSAILYYDFLGVAPGETLVRIGEEEFTEPYPYEE